MSEFVVLLLIVIAVNVWVERRVRTETNRAVRRLATRDEGEKYGDGSALDIGYKLCPRCPRQRITVITQATENTWSEDCPYCGFNFGVGAKNAGSIVETNGMNSMEVSSE